MAIRPLRSLLNDANDFLPEFLLAPAFYGETRFFASSLISLILLRRGGSIGRKSIDVSSWTCERKFILSRFFLSPRIPGNDDDSRFAASKMLYCCLSSFHYARLIQPLLWAAASLASPRAATMPGAFSMLCPAAGTGSSPPSPCERPSVSGCATASARCG